MSPCIGAVVVHEDRHIAEDANAFAGAVFTQSAPLLVEEVLDHLLNREFAAVAPEKSSERVVLALRVFGWPVNPTHVTVHAAQDIEHGVVRQPGGVRLAELRTNSATKLLRLQPVSLVMLLLVCVELVGVTQSEADIVKPVQQAILAEGINLEAGLEAQ